MERQTKRLTSVRVNGIRTGYWTAARKEEVVQALGKYEDAAEARHGGDISVGNIIEDMGVPDDFTVKIYKGVAMVARGRWYNDDILALLDEPVLTANVVTQEKAVLITLRQREDP